MTDTDPGPSEFGDEGAGPEEPPDVILDPDNQAAARAIRDSTLEESNPTGFHQDEPGDDEEGPHGPDPD